MTGPVSYWHVDDIKKSLQSLLDAGAQAQQEINDVGGGKLIASAKDADGNIIGLLQAAVAAPR
jgi:predicted enzyme related to lactoylglutathione lyase